jgi:hypothetical protein
MLIRQSVVVLVVVIRGEVSSEGGGLSMERAAMIEIRTFGGLEFSITVLISLA